MSTLLFPTRDATLSELMDSPQCDPEKLNNTYRAFATVNGLVAAWSSLYKEFIRPLRPQSLLDIGCGGGDVVRQLARWAKRDGLDTAFTAVDPDKRAFAFAQSSCSSITFLQMDAGQLFREGNVFDIVISNHVVHHLERSDLNQFCELSKKLATKLVLHNDIRRHDLAYLGFMLTQPFFRNSFITPDGLTSIRRSYTKQELQEVAPEGWQVKSRFPFRNVLLYTP